VTEGAQEGGRIVHAGRLGQVLDRLQRAQNVLPGGAQGVGGVGQIGALGRLIAGFAQTVLTG